ncbi:GNAT family N-acetyltransferase [Xanthocytophaga agilis]|uniref:GNAT family N-acetyltransferase n=1 Tax=Xanthocytophaga agilis TaxID=3048010 RepID=A0AAE3UHD3_9BACT|nr:GNAT family N-acetyltransferase [Xanthocytophaga agilis]MDJ1503342.1 GNAT family N-acetyltransferase [Xanthocytophaga agilis]
MNLTYRLALKSDLITIVQMLSDDKLGAERENLQIPLPVSYLNAFEAITRDPNQELTIVEKAGEIVATFQLTFIPYLTYQGSPRAQIEAVRVKSEYRGQGVGTEIFQYAIQRAKDKGAHLLQLTTDKKRPEAKKFYESLGFVDSHEGMKLHF